MAESKLSLKLLIDKNAKKVLFAEAGKETVDFLFYLLALPVGTVISLLTKNKMVGSIGNLYESVENLGGDYIQPNQNKDTLLKPKAPITDFPLLMIDGGTTTPCTAKKVYRCSYGNCNMFTYTKGSFCACGGEMNKKASNVGGGGGTAKKVYMSTGCSCNLFTNTKGSYCECGYAMNTEVANGVGGGGTTVAQGSTEGGGFVKGVVTYMVMDNLVVKPMSTISCITLLNQFNVKDVGDLEEQIVHLDMNKGLKLLKESLISKAVLTTVFLH